MYILYVDMCTPHVIYINATHLPELSSHFQVGHLKLQHITQSSEEGLVNVVNEVCGEDDDAGEALDVVQQHPNVHVGIAICGRAGGGGGGCVMRCGAVGCAHVKVHVYTYICEEVCGDVEGCGDQNDAVSYYPYAGYHSPHPCPLSKEALGFIKHQDGILVPRLLEDGINVLSALSDPLAEQFPAIDHLQRLADLVANGLRHHRLPSTRSSMQ